MNTPRPQPQTDGQKSIGRLLLGRAFSFRIGEMIQPLFDSTRAFVHLIAYTFATYKLLPKDYPGLQDPNANLSLFNVVVTSWKNVRHTREGAIQALLFYTVVSLMVVGTLIAISGLLSIFIGTAHAQTPACANPNTATGTFAPAECDAAQMWLSFLFEGQPLSLFESTAGSSPSWGLQDAMQTALGFYSDAILIIAALILFYHLTTMVLQTAHHGKVMGNEAKQIWAPIRLVMAIGLLVPIAGQLNSGQYIVVKTAELGSGLASQTWATFLTGMLGSQPGTLPKVMGPSGKEVANKMIQMYACSIDYRARLIRKAIFNPALLLSLPSFDADRMPTTWSMASIGGRIGMKYSFNMGSTLSGLDACGYVFIPDAPDAASPLAKNVYAAQRQVLVQNATHFYDAGAQILKFASSTEAAGGTYKNGTPIEIGPMVVDAVNTYETEMITAISALYDAAQADAADLTSVTQEDVVETMRQYGWAFAGAFLSTVERLQGMVSSVFNSGVPSAQAPKVLDDNVLNRVDGLAGTLGLGATGARKETIEDLNLFIDAMEAAWTSGATSTPTADSLKAAQCASMLGASNAITNQKNPIDWATDSAIDILFWFIDQAASANGVWKSGPGTECDPGSPGATRRTFSLSVSFRDGAEVIQEIVRFGRANIDTGLRLMAWGVLAVGGGIASIPFTGIGVAAGFILAALFELIAQFFLALGTVFAFLLPLIPFIRFFFAVLVWIGEVIESVVAIPVVALAHLNPEGEGFLSQQAKRAYGFIFSIFLRPIMTVFGLIAGLLIFIIAANFMNYAYGIAVAATGAMAFNHEVLTRLVFTILYVFTMFMCANICFSMITEFPNGAVAWMALDKSRTVNIEAPIKDLQTAEGVAAGFAIKDGVGAVSKAAQGAAGKAQGAFSGGGGGGGTPGGASGGS